MAAKKPAAKPKPAAKAGKGAGKATVKANPVGRPSSYRPEYADLARKFCLLGATDKRLAELFGVSEPTLNAWKREYPEFLTSLMEGKEIADAEVANALFHRAKGYSHAEDDIRTVSGPAGTGSDIVITPTIKHYPPDTAAATLWLKNRQPTIWRDKVDHEHIGKGGGPIQSEVSVTLTADEAYKRMLGGGA